MNKILENIIPFLIIGVSIALTVLMIIILFHVVLWGLVIGLVLYAVFYIKERFFTRKQGPKVTKDKEGHRVIEHEDE